MRGTPNDFFSLLPVPENERANAIQVFAIIRRCDDSLRFETLTSSWLIARLISILRMDSTAINHVTVEEENMSNTKTYNPSDNKAYDGQMAIMKISSGSNSKDNKSVKNTIIGTQEDEKNKGQIGIVPPIATVSTTKGETSKHTTPTISNDKPLFMYVGHLQNPSSFSGAAAMNGFATQLSSMIASFSTTKGTSTNVGSTISYCLNMLEHSKQKALLNGLCSIIIHSHDSADGDNDTNVKGLVIPEKARIDLKRILTTALCCILLQVKTSCEAVQDFDYIWEACREKASSSVFDDNQISRECAWMLSIATYLENNEENNVLPPSSSHDAKRYARLILSGTCIAIVARSALWLGRSSHTNINDVTTKNNTMTSQVIENESKYHDEDKKQTIVVDGVFDSYNGSMVLLDVIVHAINELNSSSKSDSKKKVSSEDLLGTLRSVVLVASKVNLLYDDNNIESIVHGSGPIQSLFSTHHGRITAIALLTKFCHALMSSNQMKILNGPSIFTSFSFVDETLLEAQATSYIRLYLIDIINDKKSSPIGRVAAEVQFYNNNNTIKATVEEEKESGDLESSNELSSKHAFELKMWTCRLLDYSEKRIKPSTKLLFYIGSSNVDKSFCENQNSVGQVMIPIINNALERLNQCQKDVGYSLKVDLTGGIGAHDHDSFSSKLKIKVETIGRAMLSLYYQAVESILDYETARLKTTSHRSLLISPEFHRSLLSICLLCVVHATSGSSLSFRNGSYVDTANTCLQSILTFMDCTPYDYMKVSESFLESMESSAINMRNKICKLPKQLEQKLRDSEDEIVETLLWKDCSDTQRSRLAVGVIKLLDFSSDEDKKKCLPIIKDVRQESSATSQEAVTAKLISEGQYVEFLLQKLIRCASQRLDIICTNLGVAPKTALMKQVWDVFIKLLSNHMDLIYGRHIDHIILCTIYGVARVMKHTPELTFLQIIEVYTSSFEKKIGKTGVQKILRNVLLSKGDQEGSVIDFYNQCYIKCMKKVLIQVKHLNESNLEKTVKKRSPEETQIIDRMGVTKKPKLVVTLEGSNLQVNINGYYDSKPRNHPPKSRVLYSFGDASSVKIIGLINKVIMS